MDDLEEWIVIDNGSGDIKADFNGNELPGTVFPSVVGYKKDTDNTEFYVGSNAQAKRELLSLSYPIKRGIITNWEDIVKVWDHIFYNELQISDNLKILMTESPLNPKANREKTIELIFETYNTTDFYLASSALLSLYESGRSTGIVVNAGHGVIHTVPIYEGYQKNQAITQLDFAGQDLTSYLKELLREKGYENKSLSDDIIVDEIKNRMCSVAYDFEKEIGKVSEDIWELPDSEIIFLDKELLKCPEALFQPSLSGIDSMGLHEAIYKSIMNCDVEHRKYFFEDIVLAGGSTMFPGMAGRVAKEIPNLGPNTGMVKVVDCPNRNLSAWVGGSILTSLSTFKDMKISRVDYLESGPQIVSKCI